MKTVKKPAIKVTSTRLKTYLDAKKNDSVLIGAVDQWLQLQTDDRDATVIHPSEMSQKDWCPRATYLRLIGRTARPVPVTLKSNLIFGEGHDIHTKWQTWLAGMGILWGRWKCQVCGEVRYCWADEIGGYCPSIKIAMLGDPPNYHIWEYKEVPLDLSTHRIEGHADGIVNPTSDESLLLEIKSIGPGTMRSLDLLAEDEPDFMSSDKFSKISRPMNSHFLQTQIYLRLSEKWKAEVGPVTRACIIYEHKADQQFREFIVTRNDKWTDPVFETAMDIVWAIDNGRTILCPFSGCAKCIALEEV